MSNWVSCNVRQPSRRLLMSILLVRVESVVALGYLIKGGVFKKSLLCFYWLPTWIYGAVWVWTLCRNGLSMCPEPLQLASAENNSDKFHYAWYEWEDPLHRIWQRIIFSKAGRGTLLFFQGIFRIRTVIKAYKNQWDIDTQVFSGG